MITPPCWGKGTCKPRVLMQQQKREKKLHIWELSSAFCALTGAAEIQLPSPSEKMHRGRCTGHKILPELPHSGLGILCVLRDGQSRNSTPSRVRESFPGQQITSPARAVDICTGHRGCKALGICIWLKLSVRKIKAASSLLQLDQGEVPWWDLCEGKSRIERIKPPGLV